MTARVVVTHDFMEVYGGAERVTAEIAAAFPDAPVIALLGREAVAERMGVADRFHSVVAPRPGVLEHYRFAAPVWGRIAERAALPEADVVISSSYAYAHRMRPPGASRAICYCHSPLRFAWSMTDHYRELWAPRGARARLFDLMAGALRRGDRAAALAVDRYLTQSPFTAEQIRRFYRIEADVIGAPIDGQLFRPGSTVGDHFLLVSRLVEPYKRVTVAVEAFRRMPEKRLIIVGDGPAAADLARDLPPNVEMTGALEDAPLVELMQSCLAAVFPSRDDFGLVPVEVMACGRPVLAYGDGGALHTIVPGVTGEFFDAQTPEAVVAAVEAFDPAAYDPGGIRQHALQWDRPRFHERLVEAVREVLEDDVRADRNGTGTVAAAGNPPLAPKDPPK
jgi:glycosyltransferase involved in cell wall biosynthesis